MPLNVIRQPMTSMLGGAAVIGLVLVMRGLHKRGLAPDHDRTGTRDSRMLPPAAGSK